MRVFQRACLARSSLLSALCSEEASSALMLSLAHRAPLGTCVQLAHPASLPLRKPYCWARRAPIVRLQPAQADFFGKLFGSGEEVDEEGKLVPLVSTFPLQRSINRSCVQ